MISALGDPIKILTLFLSMTVLSIFLDETGFFKWLANAVLKKTRGNQFKLFTALFLLVAFVTIFTSNDIIILTFTPFICYFAKSAKIDPVPYLVQSFVVANTCSMLLVIGNPTNIYLAGAAGIDFIAYLRVMALPTVLASVTAYVVLVLLFRKKLRVPISGSAPDDTPKITDGVLLSFGFAILSICTVMLAVSSYIGLEMWYIAMSAAFLLIISAIVYAVSRRSRPAELIRTFKRTPWMLVPFLLIMFVAVWVVEKWGFTSWLAAILHNSVPILTYGVVSTISANLINNIPMSVLFSAVLSGGDASAIYATVIGSNIGAFLTPLGALAGLMWLSILKRHEIKFGFSRFVTYGLIVSVPVLSAALLGLWIVFL